jgi:hypothetical protein
LLAKSSVWFYCVVKTMLKRSSKFITWRQSKWEHWFMPPLAFVIFVMLLRMLPFLLWMWWRRNTYYITCFTFFAIFVLSFLWFCRDINSKCVMFCWWILHWFYLLVPSDHLQSWVAYDIPNVYFLDILIINYNFPSQ